MGSNEEVSKRLHQGSVYHSLGAHIDFHQVNEAYFQFHISLIMIEWHMVFGSIEIDLYFMKPVTHPLKTRSHSETTSSVK